VPFEGRDRRQGVLLPEYLDDYVSEENPVRVVEALHRRVGFRGAGFCRCGARADGSPGFHPAALLKIYLYGYLNQVQSSRRLEREAQ
jgi:transposase